MITDGVYRAFDDSGRSIKVRIKVEKVFYVAHPVLGNKEMSINKAELIQICQHLSKIECSVELKYQP